MRHVTPKAAILSALMFCAGGAVMFLALRVEAAPPAADELPVADAPLVLYGEDGVTPVYIEDPVDEYGIPIPIGPQHQATAVHGRMRAVPTQPPAPFVESDYLIDEAGNKIPVDKLGLGDR